MKILITGGAGFIGSHATKLFLEKGYEVVVFDNFYRGYHQAVEILKSLGSLSVVDGDLRDFSSIRQVFNDHQIHAVLHFAALCLVSESMQKPTEYFENNCVGSLNLFKAMSEAGVKKIIFSSTCAVYGESQYLPMDEKHPLNPLSPYGESKLITEQMLRWFGEQEGFSYVTLRYFNVCGAASDGLIGDSKKPSQLLMQNAVRGAMGIQPFSYTCPKVDTPDGTPIRDYVDVEDLALAHFDAYKYLDDGGESQIINLGNGAGYSVKQIVDKVEQTFGTIMEKVPPAETRQGEYAAVYADPTKAHEILGWKALKSLEDSIESMRKWYSNHPHGYDE
ncbi:MAG: UDP-glucose 4-epimerase GalE [Pseudomonadales bacterium]|jgi:UDP-glucose 4-epimerase|nr:UDP-glucose 4-epimerase GalE [Pseudomonadales bacterium]